LDAVRLGTSLDRIQNFDIVSAPGFSELKPDVQAKVTEIFDNIKTEAVPKKGLIWSRTKLDESAIRYLVDLRQFEQWRIASAAGVSEAVVSRIKYDKTLAQDTTPPETTLKRKRDDDKV
jgi:hypothetical protein